MVEVFKTNIKNRRDAKEIIDEIKSLLSVSTIHIDLEDCDKVLRVEVETGQLNENEIIDLVRGFNFRCEVLDY